MPDTIVLSATKPEEAQDKFNEMLKKPVTLVVILGNDELAKSYLAKAYDMINDGSPENASIRAVHAINPEYIKNILAQLKLKPGHDPVNWNKMQDYILISISKLYHNIGRVFKRTEFPGTPDANIDEAIIDAEAADKKL